MGASINQELTQIESNEENESQGDKESGKPRTYSESNVWRRRSCHGRAARIGKEVAARLMVKKKRRKHGGKL
ncbi:hypothetical protein ACFX2F_017104 [Malus domestica]